MNRARRWLGLVPGLLLSAACLFLAIRGIDGEQFQRTLSTMSLGWMLAALGVNALRILAMLARWAWLLSLQGPVPGGLAARSLLVGVAANSLLPGRAGDLLRVGGLRARTDIPTARLVAAMLGERLSDLVGLLLLLGGVLLLVPALVPALRLSWPGPPQLLSIAGLGALALAAAAILWRRSGWVRRQVVGLGSGMAVLRSPFRSFTVLGLSLVGWVLEALSYLCVFRAADLDAGPLAAAAGAAAGNLVMVLPSAPGGLGPFEFAFQLVLGLFGVGEAEALAAALVAHAVALVPATALGLVLLASWIRPLGGLFPATRGRHAGP